jgi:hypothetical protein
MLLLRMDENWLSFHERLYRFHVMTTYFLYASTPLLSQLRSARAAPFRSP